MCEVPNRSIFSRSHCFPLLLCVGYTYVLCDAVERQGLRGGAPTLVESGQESVAKIYFVVHGIECSQTVDAAAGLVGRTFRSGAATRTSNVQQQEKP